jgi:hypothetical protein
MFTSSLLNVCAQMMMPGKYRIKTAGHIKGGQPAGWGLAAWQLHGGQRNVSSSWVAVHSGDHWPCDWSIAFDLVKSVSM